MFIPIAVALIAIGFLCLFGRNALWRIAHSHTARGLDVATPTWEWSMILAGSVAMTTGVYLLITAV